MFSSSSVIFAAILTKHSANDNPFLRWGDERLGSYGIIFDTMRILFAASLIANLQPASPPEAPVITSCAQLAHIAVSGDPGRHNFDVTGNVSFVVCNSASFIGIQDQSGAVLTYVSSKVLRGDRIRVKGNTIQNSKFHASLHAASIERLGSEEPPNPIPASAKEIASGALDFHLISFTGTVKDAFPDEIDGAFFVLSVLSDRHLFYVFVFAPKVDASPLIGNEFRFTGICEPRPHSNRKYIGKSILVNPDDIRPSGALRHDPFAVPSVDELVGIDPQTIGCLTPHQTTGRVLATWGKNKLIVRNNSDEVFIAQTSSPDLPEIGDIVALSGFPETDLYHITFDQAVWKRLPGTAVQDLEITPITSETVMSQGANGAIQPRLHGRSVRIRGIVRSLHSNASGDGIVSIESDGKIVPVITTEERIHDLRVAGTIDATGICIINADKRHSCATIPHISGFSVVTCAPSDIVILTAPSWWTTRRLLAVIGGLVVLLVTILIWNASLRILANRRGHALLKARIGKATEKIKVSERTRLAVELHDSLAQNLSGISMEIESAINFSEDDLPEARRHLHLAAKALKSSREELRDCLFDLRSQALEDPSLSSAITRTLQPHLHGTALSVRFDVPRKNLDDTTVQALLRAIRELVVNGVRHGKASAIEVMGEIDDTGLKCSVHDNGCGFNPDNAPGVFEGHFGLQGVRERIESLGGTLEISSVPGEGTTTVIMVHPVRDTPDQFA